MSSTALNKISREKSTSLFFFIKVFFNIAHAIKYLCAALASKRKFCPGFINFLKRYILFPFIGFPIDGSYYSQFMQY